jgi:hypothetical protein
VKLRDSQRFVRRLIKRFIYSQLSMREALFIALRKSQPLVLFNIEADPPSIYINFRIRPDRIDALEAFIDLPDGLTLMPIRCLEGEDPFLAITLNAYRVSGLANGVRAEWSVYVRDHEGKPRYLVLEAQSDAGSMDPVNIVTRPGDMEHTLEGDLLRTRVATELPGRFLAEARIPAPERRQTVMADRQWIEANDYIYWRNGICDRTFHDGAMANTPLWCIPSENLRIEDASGWHEYIEPEPVHGVVFARRVQLAISPWWNV